MFAEVGEPVAARFYGDAVIAQVMENGRVGCPLPCFVDSYERGFRTPREVMARPILGGFMRVP